MSQIKIIIQSRTDSSRLPGKALLPVQEIPSAVLCAKRAANTGFDICVATSLEHSDNLLAQVLDKFNIPVFRGPLEDVFERFIQASKNYPDNSIIVRLTADNLFPDGAFIQHLVNQLQSLQLNYITTSSPQDGLPYGMSAEVFTLKSLRDCNNEELSTFDREHVTPAIRRKYGNTILQTQTSKKWEHLRCTMDSFDDYLQINEVFSKVDNPLEVSWGDLCSVLSNQKSSIFRIPWTQIENNPPLGKIVLGTAQLGIDGYGIVNHSNKSSDSTVETIIKKAIDHGVTTFDCARAYGQAEHRVGRTMKKLQRPDITIITKLDPLENLPHNASDFCIYSAVDSSIYRSCCELNTESLDVVMLHRWCHHKTYNGLIWQRLKELKSKGLIKELGASVYTPKEAIEAISNSEIKHLQIPFNLLDSRWHALKLPDLINSRSDLTVYARSAFLQGLLLHGPEKWPRFSDLNVKDLSQTLDDLVTKFNRKNRADLCIAYMSAQTWIDATVIGIDSINQLQDILELSINPPLSHSECQFTRSALPKISDSVLNPALWDI